MKKLMYLILLIFSVVAGCAKLTDMNASSSGGYRQNGPSVLYEGTGITDPNSEL